ncbi:EamA family transporter [Cognatiyoonia sp. IB215182]|uniref:EamA family transporter n=1 Tax=Cognatiyoonia sp. IB215182 TaxID=3097353 RepID=UPI002A0B0E66|nr:EamA family transporter [Cognatiyoonia sp. IB215182]MDX8355851.1 EamA family transporter [Cognatiyoonia sp. IB215182]
MQPSAATQHIPRGAAYVVVAALLFALAPAVARSAAQDINILVLVFLSNVWMFVLMCLWVWVRSPIGGLGTSKLWMHFLRSILTYGSIVTYFFAVTHIPFAHAVILQSTGPLFVPVLAWLIFRRLSDRYVWLGVLVSFVGVTLIVRPDAVGISVGEASALLAALGGAGAALVIWSLGTTEPPDRQMFYFALFALLLSTLPLPWVWQWPTVHQTVKALFIAALSSPISMGHL